MKKGLTVLMTAMIVLGIILGGGVTVIAADDFMIGRELSIAGEGTIDIDLEVQTEKYYGGLKLCDRVYTPARGFKGVSYVEYVSELEMGRYNDSDNITVDMEYAQTVNVENAKGQFIAKNYVIGSASGYEYVGNVNQDVSVYSDSTLSESDVTGAVEGEMTLVQKVVDPETRVVMILDVSNFVGNFNYNHSTYVEYISYPAAGREEYLGCP